MIGRREFLKAGLAGSVMLTCVARVSAASASGEAKAGDDEGSAMLAAVAGAVLAGVLPPEGAARAEAQAETVAGVHRAIAGLSPHAQQEIAELFALLTFAPSRRWLAGVASPWREATVEEVAAFLENWRRSRFALLQTAYAALHDLVLGAWYARPDSWPAIGYPGSPEVF